MGPPRQMNPMMAAVLKRRMALQATQAKGQKLSLQQQHEREQLALQHAHQTAEHLRQAREQMQAQQGAPPPGPQQGQPPQGPPGMQQGQPGTMQNPGQQQPNPGAMAAGAPGAGPW